MKTKNSSEVFMKSVQDLVQGRDISYIAAMLAQEIGQAVVVTDAVNRVVAFHDPVGIGVDVGAFFPLQFGRRDGLSQFGEGQWRTEKGVYNYVHYAIQLPDKPYGNCIVLCSGQELDARQKAVIQQVSLTLLLALKEEANKQAIQERLLDEFTYDVLYNNYDSKVALYEKAGRLNWDLEGPFALIVVDAPRDKLPLVRRSGPAKFNSSSPIYTVIHENVVIILSLANLGDDQIKEALTSFTNELLDNLAFNYVEDVHMGIGSKAACLTDLHQRFQEAKVALELGKVLGKGSVNCFDEMGVLKFVFTAPAQELQEFAQRVLGKVLAYDLEMETDLLNTLEAYIEHQCQISKCAEALYIHENTLRNRKKRIEQLLNYDLRRIEHLLNIYIALQILKIDH